MLLIADHKKKSLKIEVMDKGDGIDIGRVAEALTLWGVPVIFGGDYIEIEFAEMLTSKSPAPLPSPAQ